MRRWLAGCVFVVAWGLVASPRARAQGETSTESGSITIAGLDARSIARNWLVLPEGSSTLLGQLRFMTAREGLGVGELHFTDVVLVDLHGQRSLGGKADLHGGLTLLPKQPSRTGELIWQGATLGGRLGFGGQYAVSLNTQVGPMLQHAGLWSVAELSLETRRELHDTFYVQGSLRGAGTALLFRDEASGRQGFGELVVDGAAVIREPRGLVAAWIGAEFRFPVRTFSSTGGAVPPLDPQTRVNVRLGGSLSYIDEWDISAELVVMDRGDASEPATLLPILDGGFDQTLLMLGFTRRFGGRE